MARTTSTSTTTLVVRSCAATTKGEAVSVALRRLAAEPLDLAEQRDEVDTALAEAIRSARAADRAWSEIGAMLGVSKQAAQRKYARRLSE